MSYATTAANALKTIQAKGKAYTLRRATVSTDTATPWKQSAATNADYTIYAVREEFNTREVDGENIQVSDLKLMVAASGLTVTPRASDLVLDGSTSYRVIDVKTLMPASTPILHTLQVRE